MIKTPSQDYAVIKYANRNIIMHTPNDYTERRAYNMFSKERDTTKWISKLKSSDILWDIGACVGTYTIMAGVVANATVYAFEPLYANVNNLNSNIVLNNLEEKCKAYCCAISDTTGVQVLDYDVFDAPGQSDNQISQTRNFKQGMLTYSIDDLVKLGIPQPTHIKIDVDGIEGKILKGGLNTFRNVKSMLVEMKYLDKCNQEEYDAILHLLSMGFTYNKNDVAVTPNNGSDVVNYIFSRPD
jgi:FkbM family methyltransferase